MYIWCDRALYIPCQEHLQRMYTVVLGCSDRALWRSYPDLNGGITVLQTVALPLGYSSMKPPVDIFRRFNLIINDGEIFIPYNYTTLPLVSPNKMLKLFYNILKLYYERYLLGVQSP